MIPEKIKDFAIGILCFILVGAYCYWVISDDKSRDYGQQTISESAYYDCIDENIKLKEKLDNINQMARDREYNYSEVLDDIEKESIY